ncbi:MAG: cytochrome c-type biogenesis protein CcmH [Solirubrobacteraceae bacterium]
MTFCARHRGLLATCLVAVSLVFTPAAWGAGRASFLQIQNDMMCVSCHEPLAMAQSQQAFSERSFIRLLISQGLTTRQIEQQMVANYGPAVLAKPPASGFNLVIYVLPPVLLAIGAATLLVTIPRWRRRSALPGATGFDAGPGLDPEDARRLDEDLARQA